MMSKSLFFGFYDPELFRSKGMMVDEDVDLGIAIVRHHKSIDEWKKKTYGECNLNDELVHKHRSVVYSLNTRLPLSVAPVRRLNDEDVYLSKCSDDDWAIQTYIDGTMINVFWNPMLNPETGSSYGWTLASRSKLHATCKFTSDRLFKELFEEARLASGIDHDMLNKNYCYSFELLHPESRHIIPIGSPSLVLVNICSVVPKADIDGTITGANVSMLPIEAVQNEAMRIGASVPATVDTCSVSTLLAYTQESDQSSQLQGWVIVPKSGGWERIRVLSESYELCVKLRGFGSNLKTNYLRLMSMDESGDMIRKYAEFYPEEKDAIVELSKTVDVIIGELLVLYKDRHVNKKKEHGDLPHWCRKPIWDLHGRYLRSKKAINRTEIMNYFRTTTPSNLNRMLKQLAKEKASLNLRESRSTDVSDTCDE